MKRELIKQVLEGDDFGATVTVAGWVRTRRDSKGGFSFLELNDGSSFDGLQVIADGISREDWKLIEKTAPLIADHPQPPINEKVRILAFVGTDVSRFKGHDEKTHEAARVLGESAAREDGYAIISDFATLQNTCFDSHH